MTKEEYFFYEWLIIEKQLTEEKFKQLTPQELKDLKTEYSSFESRLRG